MTGTSAGMLEWDPEKTQKKREKRKGIRIVPESTVDHRNLVYFILLFFYSGILLFLSSTPYYNQRCQGRSETSHAHSLPCRRRVVDLGLNRENT